MKTTYFLGFIALFTLTLWGCDNTPSVTPEDDAVLSSARLTGDTTGFHCRTNVTRIDVATLPAAITSAISASYAGATINYAATDDTGNFLVAITQNSERLTLLFNADGTFNRALSFRGRRGGFGRNRDSLTQVAITALPAAIVSYITTNYAGATVNTAAIDASRGYVVMITLNDQRKALLFNLDGTFAQEVTRGIKGNYSVVDASTLPAAVTTYITTNYAGSTIRLVGKNSTGQFKVYVQLATGQIVELSFAADGTFVQARRGRR